MAGRKMRTGASSFWMEKAKRRRQGRWLCVSGMLLEVTLSGLAETWQTWRLYSSA